MSELIKKKYIIVTSIILLIGIGAFLSWYFLVKKKEITSTFKQIPNRESFLFETNPLYSIPQSQVALDNLNPKPCCGGFKGRPIYFDYTSSNDVQKYCGEKVPDAELGRDLGFRGRRALSSFNCRDPNIA